MLPQIEISGKKKLFKTILLGTIIGMIVLYKLFAINNHVVQEKVCIMDETQRLFLPWNKELRRNRTASAVFLGIGQIVVDFIGIGSILLWLIKIQNFRLPVSLGLYFGIRSIIIGLQRFPYPSPDTVVWVSPGFPSLLVPYQKTRDFFFSGHTGTMTLLTCQLFQLRYKVASYISLFGLFYIIIMLLGTHAHYTADIFTGLIFAYFCFTFVKRYLKTVDYIVSLPYAAICYLKSCFNKKQIIEPVRYIDETSIN